MDIRISKLFVQLGFWAALCDAFIIGALSTAMIVNDSANFVIHLFPFIDVIILIILSIFLHKKSRIAGLLLVIYQIAFHIISIGQTRDYLQILWLVFFILGFLGALRYQKILLEQGLE